MQLKRKMKESRVNTVLINMDCELKVGRSKFTSYLQVQTMGRAAIKSIHMKTKGIFMQYSPKIRDQVRDANTDCVDCSQVGSEAVRFIAFCWNPPLSGVAPLFRGF